MEQPSLRNIGNRVEWKSDNYGIKPHPSRLVGGTEMWNRLVPHPHVMDKNLGGISSEQGVPDPHQAPLPRVPVTER